MTHRMMMLVIQFGIIIFFARLAGMAFSKAKLPGVLGELFAGMLLGAYALGQFPVPGFPHGLFPLHNGEPVSPELYGLATIASIVLLFNVGLETDLKMLFRYFFAGTLVGVGGVIASVVSGVFTGFWFSGLLGMSPVSVFDPVCLFLGISSAATSVGITARILSEKRKLDSPEGVTILSAAVIDDVIGIILLAVVSGMVASTHGKNGTLDWAHIGLIGIKAVSVWLAAMVAGIWAARKIAFLLKMFGGRTSIAVMAFGLALILSGLFEEAGLAMIIGAYVMGLSLSRSDIVHVIRERMHAIYVLLVPVFFFVTGMFINMKAVADLQVLLFAGIYTAVAFSAKVLGCGLPALAAKFNLIGASRVGLGMVPRGEVGLIIATLGMAAGILNDRLFAAVIIMLVVNTVVAPLGLVKLFENERSGVADSVGERSDTTELRFNFSTYALVELFLAKLTEVFDEDGFFTHLLSHGDQLYQARKENQVIEYQRTGNTARVVFREENIPLVHAAVLDAVASVELAVKELKSPLCDTELHQTLTTEAHSPGYTGTHAIAQVLKPHMVKTGLHGTSKSEVLRELLMFLCDSGQLPRRNFDEVLDEILTREGVMSTGFAGGLAIPHARVNSIDSLISVVGIYPHGIDFDAMDGNLSYVFVLVLSPESHPTPHLEFIAEVAGVFQRYGLEQFLGARDSDAVYEMLMNKSNR